MAGEQEKTERPKVTVIQQISHAYWQSALLHAASELGIFTALAAGSLTGPELAQVCRSDPRATEMLAIACVALGLLEKENEKYRNAPVADLYLVKGKAEYQGDNIAHAADMWRAWGKLSEVVRSGQPVPRRSMDNDPKAAQEVHRHFIMAMHANASVRARFLVESLDIGERKQLLDVGGGPGTYSIALCRAHPNLRATIMDLPQTLSITHEIVASAGLAARIGTKAGDFTKDPYGEGHDLVLLSNVLHQEDAASCLGMLRRSYDSMIEGGLVVVQDTLLNREKTGPIGPALFALNMLIHTASGGTYTVDEIGQWMREVGFHDVAEKQLPGQVSLVVAVK